jgi:hypothetical protein
MFEQDSIRCRGVRCTKVILFSFEIAYTSVRNRLESRRLLRPARDLAFAPELCDKRASASRRRPFTN